MNIEEDVIETLNKTIKFYEDLDILYNSKEPCPEIRAIKWIITAYEKEKEKNKELENKLDEINNTKLKRRNKTMLSDEEKKAIEYLKQNDIVEIQYDNYGLESIHRVGIDEKQTILNLIEKQSKEIEELKEDKYGLEEEVQIQAKNLMLCEDAIKETYTKWIDKIKAKIEELDYNDIGNFERRCKQEVLQSLLEKE